MIDKENALRRIEELIQILNYHTDLYDKGIPEISDTEWDKLYFELQELENEFDIYLPDSPTQNIHYEIKNALTKVKHNHPMLSLDKTKDMQEVYQFIGNKDFLSMCKMDGLTCSLRYINGNLVSAETRGDGEIGEDILHNALTVKTIPKKINYKDELIVDGEIICTYQNFEKFKDEYQNPRNFASGSIRLLDSNECAKRDLTFIAWDVIKGFNDKLYLSEKLWALADLSFTIVPWVGGDDWDAKEFLVNRAKDLGYPIDGLVFKFDDIAYGESLGATGHHKKNAIAFKFEDELFESKLKYITWQIGRTGVLTPVAVFDPVEIDFTVVERASLHNVSIMENLLGKNPYVGEPIHIFKANQIVPQIMPVSETEKYDDLPPWLQGLHKRTECPYCGAPIEYITSPEGTETANCVNEGCAGRIECQLDYFCSRKGLNIMYISAEILNDLVNYGFISKAVDLFKLSEHRSEWIKKDGYGVRSVDRILNSIEQARTTTLDKFITSLGIDLIGEQVAKDLCKYFIDYVDFRDACQMGYKFEELPNFGEAKATALRNYDFSDADEIYDYLIITNPYYENTAPDKPLEGMTIVITGSLGIFKNRDQLKEMIEKYGGKVAGSVSKNTNCLINNDVNSTSSKNQKAKALGVEIISEPDFIKKYLDNVLPKIV